MWSSDKNQPVDVRSQVEGMAWVGGICQEYKYSISEEQGGFQNIEVLNSKKKIN